MRTPEEIRAELNRLIGIVSYSGPANISPEVMLMIEILESFGCTSGDKIKLELKKVAKEINALPLVNGKTANDSMVRIRGAVLLWILGHSIQGMPGWKSQP